MRRDINFFSMYRPQLDKTSSGGKDSVTLIGLISIIGCIVILGAIWGVISLADMSVKNETKTNNEFLASEQVKIAEQKLTDGNNKISVLQKYEQAGKTETLNFGTLPKPSSKLMAGIASMAPADVTVGAMSYVDPVIVLTCFSKDKNSCSVFVHTLNASGKFVNANYSGFKFSDETKLYTFNVVMTLKGGDYK